MHIHTPLSTMVSSEMAAGWTTEKTITIHREKRVFKSNWTTWTTVGWVELLYCNLSLPQKSSVPGPLVLHTRTCFKIDV